MKRNERTNGKHLFFLLGRGNSTTTGKKNLLKIVHTSMIASYSFYFYFRLIHASTKKGEFALILEMFSSTSSSSSSASCASLYRFFLPHLIGYVRIVYIAVVHHHHHCQWSNNDQLVLIFHITVVSTTHTPYNLHIRIIGFGNSRASTFRSVQMLEKYRK